MAFDAVAHRAPAFAADPSEFAALAGALQASARSLEAAAGCLQQVRAGATQWAVDGNLPTGLHRLLVSLDWAVGEANARSVDLARQVAAAGDGYRSAEDAAMAVTGRPGGMPSAL